MIRKFAVLTTLVLSASGMLLHQAPIPVLLNLQYDSNPNYNFAYEVNDRHTGDIKSQHESRRGDTVLGQYSLIQPDGIQRTVDYRADDHTGFQATVNNEARHANRNGHPANVNGNSDGVTRHPNLSSLGNLGAVTRHPNVASLGNIGAVQTYQAWPAPTASYPHPTPTTSAPAPVAISRSSIIQTISHGQVPTQHNPHSVWA